MNQTSKPTEISRRFATLLENHTPAQVIEYLSFLDTCTDARLLESSEDIFREPTRGAEYMLEAYELMNLNFDQLSEQSTKLTNYWNRKTNEGYDDAEHLHLIEASITLLERQLDTYRHPDQLKADTLIQLSEQLTTTLEQTEATILFQSGVTEAANPYRTEVRAERRAATRKYRKNLTLNDFVIAAFLGNLDTFLKLIDSHMKDDEGKSHHDRISKAFAQLKREGWAAKSPQDIKAVIAAVKKARADILANGTKYARDTRLYHTANNKNQRELDMDQFAASLLKYQGKLENKLDRARQKHAVGESLDVDLEDMFWEDIIVEEAASALKQQRKEERRSAGKSYRKALKFKDVVVVGLLGNLHTYLQLADMNAKDKQGISFTQRTHAAYGQLKKQVKSAETPDELKKARAAVQKLRTDLQKNGAKYAANTQIYHQETHKKQRQLMVDYLAADTLALLDMLDKKIAKGKAVKENVTEMNPTIGAIDESDLYEEELENMLHEETVVLEFAKAFVHTFMDTEEDINLESFNQMMHWALQYDLLQEGLDPIRKGARKVALAADKVGQKTVQGAKKAAAANQHVTAVAKRVPKHLDDLVSMTFGKLKAMDEAERRNKIVEGGFRTKIYRLLKMAAVSGAAALVNPALGAVALIVSLATNAKIDYSVRQKIVRELEDELKIVNEKLEDSKSDADKSKKYQLMRLKNTLENDIRRIQYSLKK